MKNLILILFLLFSNFLISQNLIQNPSFEDHNSNYKVKKWKVISDKAISHKFDVFYFNETNSHIGFTVPYHIIAFQNAYFGKGYIGMSFFLHNYFQTKLINPMLKDSLYYIRFYTNLSDTSKYAISNFGVFFSNKKIKRKDKVSHNEFEPAIMCSDIVCDTVNWTKVSGIYKARGDERYLVLGMVNTKKYFNLGYIKKALEINDNCYKGFLTFISVYYFDDFSVLKINKTEINKYKTGNYPINKYDKSKIKEVALGRGVKIIKDTVS